MFAAVAQTLTNCFKIPELKSRIVFTLFVLFICRLVSMIPIPGLDGAALSAYFEANMAKSESGSLLGLYSTFTGGALERCAVGSLGIMPYISATIIIQLLSAVIPQLSKLSREEGGRTKIISYGRYLTILLCLGQGFVMALGFENASKIFPNFTGDLVMSDNLFWYRIQTTIVLTCGTALLMWLGEQITDRGIGNGISLIITVGILARLPFAGQQLWGMFVPPEGIERQYNWPHAALLIILLVVVIAGVVAVTQAQRKIPVQYANRTVGRKMYSGGSSFMPMKVNYAGVMPIIFAQAILMFPEKILLFAGKSMGWKWLEDLSMYFRMDSFVYLAVYGLMILFFSYFWVATMFNEVQVADELKKSGGYIPGVRPGKHTSDFLHRTMSRITFAGAIFLTMIAVIPVLMYRSMTIPFEVGQFFGGTGMLILVGVMLDTMRQMESHLLMRNYDGFLKKGRKIKGRL